MSKQTTICVSPETLKTWNELSARTRIPISTLVKEITENIQKMLDLQEVGRTLLFMSDFSPDNRHIVHIRVSDANTFGIPPELPMSEVEKAFGYARDPKTNTVIDLREKSQELKKGEK